PLASWRDLHGLPQVGSGDMFTPAGDGVPNLRKFALNLAPEPVTLAIPSHYRVMVSGTSRLPSIAKAADGHLRLIFVRRRDSAEISYAVLAAASPGGHWEEPEGSTETTIIDTAWERVVFIDSTSMNDSQARFLRVAVTRN